MTLLVLSRRPGKNAHSYILAIAFLVVAIAGLSGCGERQILSDPEESPREEQSSS